MDPVTGGNRARLRAWRIRAGVVLVGALLVLRSASGSGPGGPTITVRVNGRAVVVAGRSATVGAVLRAAGSRARDGRQRAVVSGRVLDAHARPATIRVDGAPARRTSRVVEGSAVDARSAADEVELTAVRQVPVLPPPTPSVERHLWYPGTAGAAEEVVGGVSGEVVSSRPLAEPTPPRQEEGPVVALTFDDGPDPVWTPQVLQILAEEQVPATFCMVGDMVRKRPEMTRDVAARGHAICNHTMHHPAQLDELPAARAVDEVTRGSAILGATIGQPVTLFRAPAGRLPAAVVAAAHTGGMRVLSWSVDSRDFQHGADPTQVLQRVLADVRPGAVVLLHDGGGARSATVALLRPLIQALRAQGYGFATPLAPPPPPPAAAPTVPPAP